MSHKNTHDNWCLRHDNRCLKLCFYHDSPWSNARMTATKFWVENVLEKRTVCPILQNNLKICSLLVVSCLFFAHCRYVQVIVGCVLLVGSFLILVSASLEIYIFLLVFLYHSHLFLNANFLKHLLFYQQFYYQLKHQLLLLILNCCLWSSFY